jgi:hypothetical protein
MIFNSHPVRLSYQPPANSTFLSEQTSHQQPANSTFLPEQISTSQTKKLYDFSLSPYFGRHVLEILRYKESLKWMLFQFGYHIRH